MKLITQTRFIILVILSLSLLTIYFKCTPKLPIKVTSQSDCPMSNAREDDKNYILKLNRDSLENSQFKLNRQNFIRIKLAKLLEVDTITDLLKASCSCSDLVLMGTDNSGITPSDRVATARTKLGTSGDDGTILGIDTNFIFELDLLEQIEPNLDKYADKKVYDDSEMIIREHPVRIAILDSGIDASHEDLVKNIYVNADEEFIEKQEKIKDNDRNCVKNDRVGANFIQPGGNVRDSLGHGTHVAGIILGKNKGARQNILLDTSIGLLVAKIFDKDTASLFSAICGMNYAIEMKADIINLSWGYYNPVKSTIFEDVIKLTKEKKIMVVTAAGNDNADIDQCLHWPASFSQTYENVITVAAALKTHENRVGFSKDYSNYGRKSIHLAAIGTNVLSTIPVGNAYKELSGTSMAAPLVSRYIAWLKLKGKGQSSIIDSFKNLNGLEVQGSQGKMRSNKTISDIPE